jgi:hypothetical protein
MAIEFKLVPTSGKSVPTLEKQLNKYASDGWEVAGCFPLETGSGSVLILQRSMYRPIDPGSVMLKETR